MIHKKISSLQHPLVKHFVKLRQCRKTRQTHKQTLISGKKVIKELIDHGAPIQTLITSQEIEGPYPTLQVSHDILKKITGLPEPDSLAAILTIPPFQDVSHLNRILVLDGICDPGNLGTLLRTALAFGWQGVFLVKNSCDPFHEKALRAAKGATFSLTLQEGSWQEFITLSKCFHTFLADMEGTPLQNTTIAPGPIALILSKESCGARTEAKKQFPIISIPMQKTMESLNVASAGAILLYGLQNA